MPESPTAVSYPSRIADVGGIPVLRALPTKGRRMVGAWCFLDHAGPAHFESGPGMQVGPHPHTCLQTFTWMIRGEVLHRDSLGSEQVIRPGQVNLMTAGRGIAHSEESLGHPDFHAVQLWIALPREERLMAPRFQHYPVLPQMQEQGLAMTVLAGEWLGQASPAQVHSPLMAVDMHAAQTTEATLALRPDFEYAILCLQGQVEVEGQTASPESLLYLAPGRAGATVRASADSRFFLLGGTPYDGDIVMWWNFVGQSGDEIREFRDRWERREGFGAPVASQLPHLAAPSMDGLHLRSASPKA